MSNACKIICFIGIHFFAFFYLHASDITPKDIIQQAEQFYKQKNYSKAIELYQSLIAQNYQSSELYYNLANAYFKNNQIGKAILYYEKAKLLNPSDADIKHNLTIAYNKTIDKIETKDNFFIEVTKANFLNKVNVKWMAYLSIVFSFLAFMFFALFLFTQKYKKIHLITFISATLICIAFYVIGYISEKSKNTNHFAIVTLKETRVMNEPLPTAITKFTLHEGTKVKIMQKIDNYYLIRLENGVEGWIDAQSIEMI